MECSFSIFNRTSSGLHWNIKTNHFSKSNVPFIKGIIQDDVIGQAFIPTTNSFTNNLSIQFSSTDERFRGILNVSTQSPHPFTPPSDTNNTKKSNGIRSGGKANQFLLNEWLENEDQNNPLFTVKSNQHQFCIDSLAHSLRIVLLLFRIG